MSAITRVPLHVLIADDDPEASVSLGEWIEAFSPVPVLTTAVLEGEAAVRASRLIHYDAVILDMQMHGMNGVQTADAIGAHGASSLLIAVSGSPEQVDGATRSRRFQHVFLKPIDGAALLRAILQRSCDPRARAE